MEHKCKLCSRRFTKGRALGGHMRTHFTILPVPDKAQPTQLSETSSSSSDLMSLIKLEGSIVLDGESETESKSFVNSPRSNKGKKQCRTELRRVEEKKKKKKKKKNKMSSTESGTELELLSPVASETTSEEDLAMCLMLLSRDKWVRTDQNFQEKKSAATSRDHQKIHQCQVCYKVFRSGQALGGHKRSHVSSSTAAHSSASANASLIDLNLPAPLDDAELSAIAKFKSPVRSKNFC